MNRVLAAALVLGLLLVPAEAGSASALSPDRVIVQWADGADHGEKVAARADAEVEFTADLGNRSFQLVETGAGQSPAGAVRALESDPAVALAERDGYRSLDGIPNDPLFGQLWGLRNQGTGIDGFSGAVSGADANVTAAWDRTVGSPSTVIADIDSGYRFEDPDLGPVAWTNAGEIAGNSVDDDANGYIDDVHGYDFVGASANTPTEDNDPTDDDLLFTGGHGVHTAGTIGAAGNNGVGISGVARDVRIMPLRVCSDFIPEMTTNHEDKCPFSADVAAINYAGVMHARAANMSLGGNVKSQAEINAMAAHPETLYVISAGNDSGDNDGGGAAPKGHHYPCDYRPDLEALPAVPGEIDNIVCVAATDQADHLASFSDWGLTSVDLGAPGTETLSTYPGIERLATDDFAANDFSSKWTAGGGGGFGRALPPEPHVESAGMTDTPGETATSSVVYESRQTNATAVPASVGACEIKGRRFRRDGTLKYGVFVDGGTERSFNNTSDTPGTSMVSFNTIPILGLGGHSIQIFFRWTAPAAPDSEDGFWVDDVRLECFKSLSSPDGYEFLQGTSMAAPHVTGAAALLFSLKPAATVTQVRNALLQSAAQISALNGKTTSGGRLDVSAALNKLVPVGSETVAPQTAILSGPAASTKSTTAEFTFRRTDADAASFECKLDQGAFSSCTSPKQLTVAAGAHEFQVRAKVLGGSLADPTPASGAWTVLAAEEGPGPGGNGNGGNGKEEQPTGCRVPKVAGLSLARAKAALSGAGCTLGTVSKPKPKKGKKLGALVVKSSSPAAGATAASPVALKLGPKPKKRHH